LAILGSHDPSDVGSYHRWGEYYSCNLIRSVGALSFPEINLTGPVGGPPLPAIQYLWDGSVQGPYHLLYCRVPDGPGTPRSCRLGPCTLPCEAARKKRHKFGRASAETKLPTLVYWRYFLIDFPPWSIVRIRNSPLCRICEIDTRFENILR
jgi:hypothetical protein